MNKLTVNKLKHLKAVAELCYKLAKERGLSEEFAQQMYFIGFNHDIGCIFCKDNKNHAFKTADIIQKTFNNTDPVSVNAIKYHEYPYFVNETSAYKPPEWAILCEANLKVDEKGNKTTVKKRLENIKKRYGKNSEIYQNLLQASKVLNLI